MSELPQATTDISFARLPIALFNYENGGRYAPGRYDFTGLRRAFADADTSPVLIGFNEAKEYGLWGEEFGLAAADELSQILRRPYEMRLLPTKGKRIPSMLLYDPTVLALRFWGKREKTVYPNVRSSVRFRIRGTITQFGVFCDQWAHYDGLKRWSRAKEVDHFGGWDVPCLLMGDFNGTASGPHLPQRAWNEAPRHKVHHKGLQLPDGSWGPDCLALDHLLGEWTGSSATAGWRRAPGTRFTALAEIAHFEQDMPAEHAFCPTVNDNIDSGGALLIDWILINKAWRAGGGLVPGTYHVHVPAGSTRADYPSDHRLVTATVELRVEVALGDNWELSANSAVPCALAA